MIPLNKKLRLKRIKERLNALRSQTQDRAEEKPSEKEKRGRKLGPKLAH